MSVSHVEIEQQKIDDVTVQNAVREIAQDARDQK